MRNTILALLAIGLLVLVVAVAACGQRTVYVDYNDDGYYPQNDVVVVYDSRYGDYDEFVYWYSRQYGLYGRGTAVILVDAYGNRFGAWGLGNRSGFVGRYSYDRPTRIQNTTVVNNVYNTVQQQNVTPVRADQKPVVQKAPTPTPTARTANPTATRAPNNNPTPTPTRAPNNAPTATRAPNNTAPTATRAPNNTAPTQPRATAPPAATKAPAPTRSR